ncbi:uncharacterized protein N7458_005947 [Penicillium daleae]|uniref:Uncharacterized protein n=1 Tax=Penicillium daleae TaxID=63821 RepID=A0AAD6C660_9EURO|nr:uncharacterized protein N7458_005947 [Penicillium daleae]KAJ5449498.1 hypothetical protein N7458_005947 [Penicillium daleae]
MKSAPSGDKTAVRLWQLISPCPEDGYAWSVAEGYEHLLATNLGTGSVGKYNSIINNLGRSIEAVDPETLPGCTIQNSNLGRNSPVSRVENGSFTATIRRLDSKNEELADELDRAWSRSDALRAKVEEWEAWAEAMERQLTESQNLVAQLDEELRHVEGGMAEAVKLLQSFRPQEEVQSRGSEDWYQDATRSPSLSQEE